MPTLKKNPKSYSSDLNLYNIQDLASLVEQNDYVLLKDNENDNEVTSPTSVTAIDDETNNEISPAIPERSLCKSPTTLPTHNDSSDEKVESYYQYENEVDIEREFGITLSSARPKLQEEKYDPFLEQHIYTTEILMLKTKNRQEVYAYKALCNGIHRPGLYKSNIYLQLKLQEELKSSSVTKIARDKFPHKR